MSRTLRTIQEWCKPGTPYYEEVKSGERFSLPSYHVGGPSPRCLFERRKEIHGYDGSTFSRGVIEDFDPDTGVSRQRWADHAGGPNRKRGEKKASRRRSRRNAKRRHRRFRRRCFFMFTGQSAGFLQTQPVPYYTCAMGAYLEADGEYLTGDRGFRGSDSYRSRSLGGHAGSDRLGLSGREVLSLSQRPLPTRRNLPQLWNGATMKIIYKTGNLLDATEPAIVHGCNAQGVMGSGVAKAIRDKWPEVYETYRLHHVTRRLWLGSVIRVRTPEFVILNAITQHQYGRDGSKYVSYDAVAEAFSRINEMGDGPVALPLIGAGLGGGKWSILSAIIEAECTSVQPVVYTLDGVIPT